MASIREDDNILQEESGGRRTRSGRKVTTPVTPRSTRRSTRKQALEQEQTNEVEVTEPETIYEEKLNVDEEDVDYAQSDIIKEMLAEAAQGVLVAQHNTEEEEEEMEENIQYTEISNVAEIQDIIETVECTEVPHIIETSGTEVDMVVQYAEEQIMAVEAEDEKSSSFPFGTVQQSENSDGKTDENMVTNISECVDSSLLASLVGDNANSLPSVGEESQSKENFETAVTTTITNETDSESKIDLPCLGIEEDSAESKSQPAIAEDLQNGEISEITIPPDDADAEMVSEDELPAPNAPKVADAEVVSDDELPTPTKPVIDAEIVSEDELPTPVKAKVTDAEEVSDEELPGPERAELPADTEVVSEDELPSSAKRSSSKRKTSSEEYNPSSPTGEDTDIPEKKPKLESDEENQEKKEKEKEKEKKKLPELDKYWKAVNDDPADFTGWTYLLQYVDQENDLEAAREAYDAFLAHYPYCYGYWRKYADYEKRKGNKKRCEEVFERGLKAIPLSVDLWIHYLTHVKTNYSDNEEFIRSQFERALSACGLEFRSDKLWEAFIRWELEGKRYSHVGKVYDRLLATPTQGYSTHFDSYQDLINNFPPTIILSVEEFKKFRAEVREAERIRDEKIKGKEEKIKEKEEKLKEKIKEKDDQLKEKEEKLEEKDEKIKDDDKKENETTNITGTVDETEETKTIDEEVKKEEEEEEADDHVRSEEEMAAIRDKIIASRRKVHKATVAAVTARWTYEESIKRPYFHVKPLERCQLKNWKDYLDFEIERGDRKRVLILFERCLIACALYDEFWLKLIRYLESQGNNDDQELISITRDVFERACVIHHPDKPSLHLMWSAFEECQNQFDKAAEILRNLEKLCPNLLQIAYRRINLERRRGDFEKCKQLYEHYITVAKNKNIAGSLAIKYARFLHKICGNLDDGFTQLQQTLEKDPNNTRVALQMIDLALQREKVNEEEIVQIMDKFMSRENMEPEQKVLFAQRKVEFLEDFGSTAKGLQDAQRALQIALNKANEAKKKSESSPNKKSSSSSSLKESITINPTIGGGNVGQTAASTYNHNNYNAGGGYGSAAGGTTNSQYYGGGAGGGGNQSYQQSYDSYSYNHWQQSGYGYSGYGQWSGYGNYY